MQRERDPAGRVVSVRGSRIAQDVAASLATRPRSLPSKYFYDDRGSALFERITELPEYYQTRTEMSVLEAAADDIVRRSGTSELVEIGAGSARKLGVLVEALRRKGEGLSCVLFDINAWMLRAAAGRLQDEHPGLEVDVITGEFPRDLGRIGRGPRRLLLLFGGTIGNVRPVNVPAFLHEVADLCEPGSGFLTGVDLVKDPERLVAAYDDAAGITAEFNRNLLVVMNRELGADFAPEMYEHVALWNAEESWIEMRLRARAAQRVRVEALDLAFGLAEGEEILTEISAKYTRDSFVERLAGTGFSLASWYTDAANDYALALLRREERAP